MLNNSTFGRRRFLICSRCRSTKPHKRSTPARYPSRELSALKTACSAKLVWLFQVEAPSTWIILSGDNGCHLRGGLTSNGWKSNPARATVGAVVCAGRRGRDQRLASHKIKASVEASGSPKQRRSTHKAFITAFIFCCVNSQRVLARIKQQHNINEVMNSKANLQRRGGRGASHCSF